MKRTLLFTFTSLCLLISGWTQNELDAFRHSQYGLSGTARSLGMGGAYSAVGADLSSATTNPAGLGLYRSSSIVVSPYLSFINTNTSFLDGQDDRQSTYFGLPNWGVVFQGRNYYDDGYRREEAQQGLKSYAFAFGHNQLENYRRELTATGFNTESSISDRFAELANLDGLSPDQLVFDSYPELAYSTFIIENIAGSDTEYFPAVNGGDIQQTFDFEENGRRNEFFFSLAGNFNDVIYFGGTLSLENIRYEQDLYLQEDDVNNVHEFYETNPAFGLETPMEQIRFNDNFTTQGRGVNGKFGILVRPVDPFRIGLAIQTPTFYNLTDRFTTTMGQAYTIELNNGQFGSQDTSLTSEEFEFQYQLRTPMKLTLGLMYLFGKQGFISGDVEYTNFGSASLDSDGDNFSVANNNIEDFYKNVINVRVGGEYRAGIFRLRAGAAIFGNPLADVAREYLDYADLSTIRRIEGGRRFFTLGAGIRQPNYFMDVSFINQQQEDKLNPYTAQSSEIFVPAAVISTNKNTVVMTLGFNF